MTKRRTGKQTGALADELENIRNLLSEGDREAALEVAVPLLEDVISGGMVVDEHFLTDTEVFVAPEDEEFPGLDEQTIKALMGDDWREATRKIMEQTRQTIDEDQQGVSADTHPGLNDALRARLDAMVEQWLHTLVADNITDFREQLVGALVDELHNLLGEDLDKDDEGDSGR